ncbi:MAG: SOS response-associated peptidase family protein, partial [Cyclobacteriaceae bacterium]
MIDRYILSAEKTILASRYGLEEDIDPIVTYNASPTHILPIIRNVSPSLLEPTYWGQSPEWSRNKKLSSKLYNAPISEAASKRSLIIALKSRRCLVPATGFVVWNQLGKKTAVPYLYHLPDFRLFSMAGVWEDSVNMDEKGYQTFRLLTVNDNKLNIVSPVILNEQNEKEWLAGSFSDDLEKAPTVTDFKAYSISPVINKNMKDNIEMIKHVPPVDQKGNYTLFG